MSWLKHLKMQTKLMLGFGIVMVIVTLQAVFMQVQTAHVRTSNKEQVEVQTLLSLTVEADSTFRNLMGNVRIYSLTAGPRYRQQYLDMKQQMSRLETDMRQVKHPKAQKNADEIASVMQDWIEKIGDPQMQLSDEIFAHKKGRSLDDVSKFLIAASTSPAAMRTNPTFKRMVSELKDQNNKISDAINTARSSNINLSIFGSGISIGVGLLVAFILARAISRPLREITSVAKSMAMGNDDQEITYVAEDEIGELADAFRGIHENRRVIGQACEALGRGDLTASIQPKSETDLIANSFNQAALSLRDTMREMAQSSVSLASASEELSATASEMSSNAEETFAQAGAVSSAAEQISANVQTVVRGAAEMTSSIKDIAGNAHEAAKVATHGVTIAQTANAKIIKLDESGQEIGQVVKVITSIAEQTHLLALNATIEAARAGEAGKGFAVVANEVKELAKETAKATEDISRKVEAIQADTRSAIEGIAEMGKIIEQINNFQHTIATAVEEQTATTNEISRNVSDVATGNQEVARNITGVAQAAKGTTEGAEYTRNAADELARLASTMQSLVRQFHFGTHEEQPQVQTKTVSQPSAPKTKKKMTGAPGQVVNGHAGTRADEWAATFQ